jgi:hypothetical protein
MKEADIAAGTKSPKWTLFVGSSDSNRLYLGAVGPVSQQGKQI